MDVGKSGLARASLRKASEVLRQDAEERHERYVAPGLRFTIASVTSRSRPTTARPLARSLLLWPKRQMAQMQHASSSTLYLPKQRR